MDSSGVCVVAVARWLSAACAGWVGEKVCLVDWLVDLFVAASGCKASAYRVAVTLDWTFTRWESNIGCEVSGPGCASTVARGSGCCMLGCLALVHAKRGEDVRQCT